MKKRKLVDSGEQLNKDWDKVTVKIMETYEKEFKHFPSAIDLVVSDGSQKIEIHL